MSWSFQILMQLVILSSTAGLSYSKWGEDSPFGFHPADIIAGTSPDSTFADAESIGVRWHRPSVYLMWSVVQPDLGNPELDFSLYDQIYGSVPDDIHILGNIVPQGNETSGYCIPGTFIPVDSLQYENFVRASVERYDGDGYDDMPGLTNPVKYWQVGNEPDNSATSDFAALQRMTYCAIKEADSTSTVLIGGVPGFPEDYISNFDSDYAPILIELGGNYVDVFDFHWYGNATGDYDLLDPSSGLNVLDHMRSTLTSCGFDENIPVWVTEMGSFSGEPAFPPYPYQSEAQQAGDYFKRFIYSISRGVRKIFPAFGLMEGFMHDSGFFDFTGLIYDGWGAYDQGFGVRKLGYFTYGIMTQTLQGSEWESIDSVGTGSEYVKCYSIPNDGANIYAAWYDYFNDPEYSQGDSMQLTLNGLDCDFVTVTDVVPYDRTFYSFYVDTVIVTGGSASIQLAEDPVLVEEMSNSSSRENPDFTDYGNSINRAVPNPFRSSTEISFSIAADCFAEMLIYRVNGSLERTILRSNLGSGLHCALWDGTDDCGRNSPPGVYICKLLSNNLDSGSMRLVLLD